MKKQIIYFCLLCLITFSMATLHAQKSDWKLGFHNRVGSSNWDKSTLETSPALSFGLGLDVARVLGDRLEVFSGLEYLLLSNRYEQEAYQWPSQNENGQFNPDLPGEEITFGKLRYDYHYLTLPLGVSYALIRNRFSLLIAPQTQLNYLLMERIAGEYTLTNGEQFFTNDQGDTFRLRPLTLSFAIGLRATYQLSEKLELYMMPMYSWMLSGMVKETPNSFRFRSQHVQLGLFYNL
jgi:hypothetical protein